MSTPPAHVSAYPSRTARRLAQYLRAEAQRADGDLSVTPDALAPEVGRSRTEIRTLLVRLGDGAPGLAIDPLSPAPEPTWRVSVP